jgi:hypothetical protein
VLGTAAGGVRVGAPLWKLAGHASRVSGGVWIGRRLRGGARYVYGVSWGHVHYVAVASPAEVGSHARLASDLRAAGLR